MCFSTEADLVAGAVMVPLGVLSLRQVREAREAPFAGLPLLFGVHQLVESLVWGGVDGGVPSGLAHAAAVVYVIIALPLLPTYVPAAVWLVEESAGRRRVLPFLALGLVVTAYMASRIVQNGVTLSPHPHALVYRVGLGEPELWTGLYVLAVMGACLMSASGTIRAFGLVNLVGLTVVAIAYKEAFASLWCLYAALASVLVLVHMVRRHDDPPSAVADDAGSRVTT